VVAAAAGVAVVEREKSFIEKREVVQPPREVVECLVVM
jgi:hypothetical protein